MHYIALARQWRPRSFSELLGQDPVNQALRNSLNQNRLHHAYLFTGTRGVGKTSVARLFAKALNCEQGVSAEPCLECGHCKAVEAGNFFDLIEIDAASKTRVEDTREILENVQYAPIAGRYKIYLIDEVHMLSQHSFNALLKTLEEPPSQVIFLLATTDPQKLPVTILSRCLQFHLRPIANAIIERQLGQILEKEQIAFEPEALTLLAEAARGSMRDALSLLDQSIAFAADGITAVDIKQILGYTQQDYALQLLQALAERQPERLIALSRAIALEGGQYRYVLGTLLSYLHQLSLCHELEPQHAFVQANQGLAALTMVFVPEDLQLFYEIALRALEHFDLAPSPGIGFEMALLRMHSFRPLAAAEDPSALLKAQQKETASFSSLPKQPAINLALASEVMVAGESLVTSEGLAAAPTPVESSATIDTATIDSAKVAEPMQQQAQLAPPWEVSQPIEPIKDAVPQAVATNGNLHLSSVEDWSAVLSALNLSGLARSALEQTEWLSFDGRRLELRISRASFALITPQVQARLEESLSTYAGQRVTLDFLLVDQVQASPASLKEQKLEQSRQEEKQALDEDHFLQQIKAEFNC